jgi:[acyl-carrier-protein] S-malonyltransferase
VVLAGPDATIDAALPFVVSRGAWARRLDVHVPSHTPLMREAAVRFDEELRRSPARDVASRVLRGVDGAALRRGVDATSALARAIHEPIRWDACQRALSEACVEVALELGPGRALAGLCAQCPGLVTRSVSDFRSLQGAADWLRRQLD